MKIEGTHNVANVMIDSIDATTEAQIRNFLECPALAGGNIAIMPDCHAGAGAVIGFTMPVGGYVIPNIVGVDIGCGMLAMKLGTKEIDLEKLDSVIKELVPAGFAMRSTVHPLVSPQARDVFSEAADIVGCNKERALKSIGTLGGGNHFIELGVDEEGAYWLTVHSGSRNFGLRIAKFFQDVAVQELRGTGWKHKGLEPLSRGSVSGISYMVHQALACEYAKLNRVVIISEICRGMRFNPIASIESVHNYIDENGMIRKGATDASLGNRLLIPFNMRDGIAICKGKGSAAWNFSAPHGAGRILSRTAAKRELNAEAFAAEMQSAGVYTTTATAETLDEAPGAYKPMSQILEAIKDTVDVESMIKSVYNFKAGGE